MPRARNQYIEEMRERFEVNVAGRRVDRSYKTSNEEKTTLTAATQVSSSRFVSGNSSDILPCNMIKNMQIIEI